MEYCKNCGKPIIHKIWGFRHTDEYGNIGSHYCYSANSASVYLDMVATPKTKHDKIKEIIDDL